MEAVGLSPRAPSKGPCPQRGGSWSIVEPRLLQGFFTAPCNIFKSLRRDEPYCMVSFAVFYDLVIGRRFVTFVHAAEQPCLSYEDLSSPDDLRGRGGLLDSPKAGAWYRNSSSALRHGYEVSPRETYLSESKDEPLLDLRCR